MKPFKLFVSTLAAVLFASAGHAADEGIHKGIVTFTKTAGGYSYLKIKEGEKEVWIAALPIQVSVGEEVEYAGGDIMSKFQSKAMGKTFDSIRFVSRIHVVSKDTQKIIPKDDVHKGVGAAKVVSLPVKTGEIVKPKDKKTVVEIFDASEKLKGNKVLLQAKVVKFSKNILGKNWATLSDGTGKSPDDRIVAMTMETLFVGDIVNAIGVLKTNVNLGVGYQYKVILDDTKFTK